METLDDKIFGVNIFSSTPTYQVITDSQGHYTIGSSQDTPTQMTVNFDQSKMEVTINAEILKGVYNISGAPSSMSWTVSVDANGYIVLDVTTTKGSVTSKFHYVVGKAGNAGSGSAPRSSPRSGGHSIGATGMSFILVIPIPNTPEGTVTVGTAQVVSGDINKKNLP